MNLFIRWLLYNRLRTANVRRYFLLYNTCRVMCIDEFFQNSLFRAVLCNLFHFFLIAIVYEVVYRYMYQIPNIKTVADRMLHNRTPLRHDRFFQKGNLDIRE